MKQGLAILLALGALASVRAQTVESPLLSALRWRHVGPYRGGRTVGAAGVPALPHGLDTAAALPRVTDRMLERGISETDIEKILGGNFLRTFEAIERGATGR